jgi:cytochrome c oxidase assembly factor CtaG
MPTWDAIAWFPVCIGLTAVGLVLSWLTWRRRGARRGIRGVAWSLLPLALYLTGSIVLVGRIGSAVVQFASAFVFSTKTWAGVALFAVAVLVLLVTGGLPALSPKRRARRREQARAAANGRAPDRPSATQPTALAPAAKGSKPGKGAADTEGIDKDVEEILRRRGIN